MFDTRTGRSIGFEKCLALAGEHLTLAAEEAGTLRALDALRDDEQHWLSELSEDCCSCTSERWCRCSTP